MRFPVKASGPVEKANHLARNGKLGATVRSVIEDLKPEAAYSYADKGKRTALMVLDLQDASEMPRVAEPWFLSTPASSSSRRWSWRTWKGLAPASNGPSRILAEIRLPPALPPRRRAMASAATATWRWLA